MEDDKIGKVEKLETRENRNQEELNTRHYMPWRFAKGLYTQCTDCVELATTRPRVHDKKAPVSQNRSSPAVATSMND